MLAYTSDPFPRIVSSLRDLLLNSRPINTGEWQAQRDVPQTYMLEVEDVSLRLAIPEDLDALRATVQPNLPWADDHFLERVSGKPLNPPPSSAWWPFKQRGHEEYVNASGQFSHTYPERLWPKAAGTEATLGTRLGVRFKYADLGDVVELLQSRPNTRQAFVPIWFPEDGTASLQGARVPCTIGYHFMLRDRRLTCRYYIRSCDFLRHFRDDIYLAARLTLWLVERLRDASIDARPGDLIMHISSLHAFAADRQVLEYRRRVELARTKTP